MKDNLLFVAALMGLNNRLEVNFIEEPDTKCLDTLANLYLDIDFQFGRDIGQLVG